MVGLMAHVTNILYIYMLGKIKIYLEIVKKLKVSSLH